MTDKYEALRSLAQEATPGPWAVGKYLGQRSDEWSVFFRTPQGENGLPVVTTMFDLKNAEFIAAADPKVILALLAERDALREALKDCLMLLHATGNWSMQIDDAVIEIMDITLPAAPTAPAHPERKPLTDEQIDAIAEGMPGGLGGFKKSWGWRQFARAIEAASTPNAHDACKRCGGAMGPGVVVEPHYNCSDEGTCSIAPGPATLTECRKCHSCGWSTT